MRKRRLITIAIPFCTAAIVVLGLSLPSGGSHQSTQERVTSWRSLSIPLSQSPHNQIVAATMAIGGVQTYLATQNYLRAVNDQGNWYSYQNQLAQEEAAAEAQAQAAQQQAAQQQAAQAAAQQAAAQQAAQQRAAQQAASSSTSTTSGSGSTSSSSGGYSGDPWWRVAICEEGGRNDPTYGYFGILPSTWNAEGMSGTAGQYSYGTQESVAYRIIGGGSIPDAGGCASW